LEITALVCATWQLGSKQLIALAKYQISLPFQGGFTPKKAERLSRSPKMEQRCFMQVLNPLHWQDYREYVFTGDIEV
jgi:hypothetical protein